jgi:hypothetical protein
MLQALENATNACDLSKKLREDYDVCQKFGTPLASVKSKYKAMWLEAAKDKEDMALLGATVDAQQGALLASLRTHFADDLMVKSAGGRPHSSSNKKMLVGNSNSTRTSN